MAGSGSNQNPGKGPHSASPCRSKEPSSARRQVLIVEDNRSDVYLIQRAIEGSSLSADFYIVRDGQQAVEFFDQAEADLTQGCPDIVILDLNLPKKQGSDVLRHMRSRSRFARARVIAVSSSDSERDREVMKQLGADGYFHKPSEFDEFMKLGDLVKGILDRNVH